MSHSGVESSSPRRSTSSVRWYIAGGILLAVAWRCAFFGGGQALADGADSSVDTARPVMMMGLLSWLLQWVGVSLLMVPLLRRQFSVTVTERNLAAVDSANVVPASRLDRCAAFAIPLVTGLAWWCGLFLLQQTQEGAPAVAPVEISSPSLLGSIRQLAATESVGRTLVREVLGPLVCPFKLAGPTDMRGWDFVWSLASTAWIIGLWIFAIRSLRSGSSRETQLRQAIVLASVVVLYTAPVLARSLIRLADRVW